MNPRPIPEAGGQPEPYDVIVVGGRCSGSPTAMLLARRGLRVLLVDRATFPSAVVSSHLVHDGGVACLDRWGMLPAVQAIPVPAIVGDHFDFGLFSLSGAPATEDGGPAIGTYAPPRLQFDILLVEAAAAAGVEVRQDCRVTELVWDDERVVGIRYRTSNGATGVERARMVVGADGKHSFVARQVAAPTLHAAAARSCASYAYWSGLDVDRLEVAVGMDRVVVAFPTIDSLTCVYVTFPYDEREAVRGDGGASYRAAVQAAATLQDRLDRGEQEAPCRGSADLDTYYRRSWGPGWVLVGDARHYQDPVLAQGMSNAFRDADLVAGAIAAHCDVGGPTDQLAAFEVTRIGETWPIYRFAQQVAGFSPSPELVRVLLRLREDQRGIDQFVGALAGTVAATSFFVGDDLEAAPDPEVVAG